MDEAQFLQLINQHQGIIHKICRLYRDSREDREDLFQEIVYQLWKSAGTFEDRAKFSSWMYRVALSTAMAAFRKRQPVIRYMPALPDEPPPADSSSERWEQLLAALRKLNDIDKAFITLYLEGLSYQEIARITGVTANNVGVKLNRIKIKIQGFLKS